MQVEFNDIVKDFKKKDFKPIYFFCGEENFFIDELVHLAETSIIPEESKEFSQFVVYGKDVNLWRNKIDFVKGSTRNQR